MTDPGNLITIDDRYALQFIRRYQKPVDRVWQAVTEPDQLARWFPSQVLGERAVGATLLFDDSDQRAEAIEAGEPTRAEGPAFTGTVLAFDPPHLFSFTGEPQPDGSMVWERGTHVDAAKIARYTSSSESLAEWGAGEHAAEPLEWSIEPQETWTLFRLRHPAIGGDAELAATWHALLLQLDMFLAADFLMPADSTMWVGQYRDLLGRR